jgi:hypothetical protein
VSLQQTANEVRRELPLIDPSNSDYYACLLSKFDTVLEDVQPMSVFKAGNIICITLGTNEDVANDFFAVAESVFLGIDKDSVLVSVIINTEIADFLIE